MFGSGSAVVSFALAPAFSVWNVSTSTGMFRTGMFRMKCHMFFWEM
jgi:hypothetical protein